MKLEVTAYKRLQWAASVIQKHVKAWTLAREQHKRYLSLKSAAVDIQRNYRRRKTERLQRENHAATVIQTVFKKWHSEIMARKTAASLKIQSCYRMRRCQKRYINIRRISLLIQAWYRGHAQRRSFETVKQQHHSAIVLQSAFRHLQRVQYRRLQRAVNTVQARYRANKKMIEEMQTLRIKRNAVVVLQCAFRGMQSRQLLQEVQSAACVLQRSFRAHFVHKHYLYLRSSVLAIQQRYRATVVAKQQMQCYREMRSAAILLQAAYRGQRARREIGVQHLAATKIQAAFRKHKDEVKFQAMRLSDIVIQRHFRARIEMKQDRDSFLNLRDSTIVVQAAFRGYQVRQKMARMHKAAIVIQVTFRMNKEQVKFQEIRLSAIIIQRFYRSYMQRKQDQESFLKLRHSSIVIQSFFRGMQVRKQLQTECRAAILIQSLLRKHLQRAYYQRLQNAVVVLQSAFRGMQSRQSLKEMQNAACVLLRSYRAHLVRKHYLYLRSSVLAIQQRYRATVVAEQQVQCHQEMCSAAILLQATYRGQRARRETGVQHQAATKIQAAFRKHKEEVKFQAMRLSAIIIQRFFRSHLQMNEDQDHFLSLKDSAIVIQAAFRGRWVRRKHAVVKIQSVIQMSIQWRRYLRLLSCTIKLQSHRRAWAVRRTFLKPRLAAVTLQKHYRSLQAQREQRLLYLKTLSVVQKLQVGTSPTPKEALPGGQDEGVPAQAFVLRRREQRMQQGVIRMQALWRGHHSRKLHDICKVVAMRLCLQKVSEQVREEDRLYFAYILEALKNLETATRLSPECCERLVTSGATLVIFTLIRNCNRSVPCMEVITYAVQVLLNLSKVGPPIMLTLTLQIYREKAGDKVAYKGGCIITKTCLLLVILLQDKRREMRKLPKAVERLHSIYRLTACKHKMEAERTVVKQKMNASINGSFIVQATPRKSKFSPAWVLRKDQLKDIVDPLRAIQMVADAIML
uniref:Abnormal spindle-like microcephaly-associated protein ASH domain-containing protein n=1 Tax=Esox lucius TaxID=8010 RepID=A0AAY5KP91_ESOLU